MIQTLVWTQHGAGVSPVNQSHYFITISTSENSPASLIVTAAPRLLTIAEWWEVPLIHFSYCTFISEIEIFATVYILWGKYDQVWCVHVLCKWMKENILPFMQHHMLHYPMEIFISDIFQPNDFLLVVPILHTNICSHSCLGRCLFKEHY